MKKTAISKLFAFVLNHQTFVLVVLTTLFLFSATLLLLSRKDADSMYFDAMEALGTGRAEEALATLREIEDRFPHWERMADLYYQQGNILYFHQSDIPGALERWFKVLQLNPQSPYDFIIHFRMADIYQNVVGDMNMAVGQWKYLLDKYPNRPETDEFLLNLVTCHVRDDQFETAIIEIKQHLPAVRDEHIRQQLEIKLGMIYNFQKNYDRARQILQTVTTHPHCATCRNMALMVLADTLEIQEDYQKAIEILGSIPDNVLSKGDKQSRIKNIRKKAVIPPPGPPQ